MPEGGAAPLPTLEDVAQLTRDSDYSRFVSGGIDKTVRRAALKKLFSDPHFNAMDGLDIYIDDYNKFTPLTPAMLAGLKHTQSMFDAIAEREAKREEEHALAHAEENAAQADYADHADGVEDVESEAEEKREQNLEHIAGPDEAGQLTARRPGRAEHDGLQAAQGSS